MRGRHRIFKEQLSQVVKSIFIKILLLVAFAIPALAQESNSSLDSSQHSLWQERFWDWTLYKTNRGDQIICYLVSTPIKSSSSFKNRGEPFFLVTNIKNDADEISLAAGFTFKGDTDVELSFGSKKFYLFPYRILAWANDKTSDINIIKEMQKNSDMIVTSIAKNGKMAIDTYSLIGFSHSYTKLKKTCE